MRAQSVTLAVLIAALIAGHSASAREPDTPMQFPKPGNAWTPVEYEDSKASGPWVFNVFVNSESGDLLSFAARPVQPRETRRLIIYSDSAREIFPIGHPAWTPSSNRDALSNTIRNGLVEINAFDPDTKTNLSQSALEYTLVVKVPRQKSRMVNGYAFIVDGVVVFVQHTSMNPITSDLAKTTTKKLITKCREGLVKPLYQKASSG